MQTPARTDDRQSVQTVPDLGRSIIEKAHHLQTETGLGLDVSQQAGPGLARTEDKSALAFQSVRLGGE